MISMQQIALQRGTQILFEKSDITLHPGWRVGITGINGCGKSRLFSLIRGEITTDAGTLSLPDSWQIASVKQETPDSDRTAIDYVLDGDQQFRLIQQQIEDAENNNDGHAIAELHGQFEAIDGYHASIRAQAGSLRP